MSSPKKVCTPAEIAEKRRQALERLQSNKSKRKLDAQDENRNEQMGSSSKNPRVEQGKLSDEKRAEIERNRLQALERAKANNLITNSQAELLASRKISPGKLEKAKAVPVLQTTSIYKAQSKLQLGNERSHPYQKETVPLTKSRPLIRASCTFEVVNNDRFVISTSNMNDAVLTEFKKLKTRNYDPKSKIWSFNINEYDELVQLLSSIKESVTFEKIPDWVLKLFRTESPALKEECLDLVEPTLADSLLPFQRDGVCFGISRSGRFLLADDMGLGKTRQALAVADFYKDDWPLLIVTSAAIRNWWLMQIVELLPNLSVQSITVLESGRSSLADARVIICSYALLEAMKKKFELKKFGMIIFDESHSLKNEKSKQTINAKELAANASRVVLISGTPALSRPVELFSQLAIIDGSFTDYFSFTKRYCAGHRTSFGWDVSGSSNLKELNALMVKKFMVRRTKDDVYAELGDKKREVVQLNTAKENKQMKAFANEYEQSRPAGQKEILLQWFVETAKLKSASVCHYIKDFVKRYPNEKFLIFAVHHHMLDAVVECLRQLEVCFMRIDGTTGPAIRTSNINRFQDDPKMRCAVLSIRACSAGITLTAASTVIFAEMDWTPSNIIQAESRVHRIGQQSEVKCFFLLAPGTADDVLWRMLQEKQRNLSKVGLLADKEHFSQNVTNTKFEPQASTSTSGGKKRISDFFTPSKQQDESGASDAFYSCETHFDEEIGLAAALVAEKNAKVNKVSHALYFDDEDDIDFNAALEAEIIAKEKLRKEQKPKTEVDEDDLSNLIFDDEV